jgi:hypothetical protein
MLQPIPQEQRGDWQGTHTSFDFDEMMKPVKLANGTTVEPNTMARPAGYALEQIDVFLGKLGNPVGVKSYKPYHSTGEDFLQNYIGMCGVPMDLVPEFPADASIVLLTESAKFDPAIVDKIKARLVAGKPVMITSGLLFALQGKGIEDIVELRITGEKALTRQFWSRRGFWGRQGAVYEAESEILIPQIKYLTNDSWEELSCLSSGVGYPIIHSADYANSRLYVLTIPDNYGDLYKYPAEVLAQIREILTPDFKVRLEGPSQVSLFIYDNDTFIVESFRHKPVDVNVVADRQIGKIQDLVSGERLSGEVRAGRPRWGGPAASEKTVFNLKLKPHSYRVFKLEKAD